MKLVTVFGLCFLIVAGSLVTYGIISGRNTEVFVSKSSEAFATAAAEKYILERARGAGFYIRSELEVALDAARTLTNVLSGIRDEGINLKIDRNRINGVLRNVLMKNENFLGIYTCWETNALDGTDELYANTNGHDNTGRFVPYWSREENGNIGLAPLVDYENKEKHENGVRKGDYYLLSREQKAECVIDPYPYPIHNEIVWLTSLVAPIIVNDIFYGIAGVDMRLDFIQSLAEKVNRAIYGGAGTFAVVGNKGILAANSSDPDIVGKHLRHWLSENWQAHLDSMREGKEYVDMDGNSVKISVPLKIGRTGTPWIVIIDVPKEAALAQVGELVRELKRRGRREMSWQAGVGMGIALLAVVLIWFVSKRIVRPISKGVTFARSVADGDLTAGMEVPQKDEIGMLANALGNMRDTISDVLEETDRLIRAVREGRLDVRGNPEKFAGGWQELVLGINTLIDAFTEPINMTAEHVDRISKGDIPEKIRDDYKGDFNKIRNNLNMLIDNIRGFLKEAEALIQSIREGRLDVRGNPDKFVGDWQGLVLSLNNLIDAFTEPINMTAEHIDRISKGDIPEKIRDEHKGDFNKIKNNLNMLIDATNETTHLAGKMAEGNFSVEIRERSDQDSLMQAMNLMKNKISGVLRETDRQIEAVQEGRLDIRGNADAFAGSWRELVTGVNHLVDAFAEPINITGEYIERISKGDIPEKIADVYKGDFSRIRNNLNMLIDAMNEITHLAEKMAAGDLTAAVRERSDQDRLMRTLNEMIGNLSKVVFNVKFAAEGVSSGSRQLSLTSEQISQGASEQAASAEEVSSSMEQMSANIRQNADNSLETKGIALRVAEDTREGGKAVSETVVAMKSISGKIRIIEEIARQTDLLALNAAIEAARVGEQGRGFAVVASEVRKLAERSRKAASEISRLSVSSMAIAEKAGHMLDQIVPDIQKTSELVQEISAACNEQDTGSAQINKAIQQLDQIIQQNASAAEEMASTSEELSDQARQLRDTIDFLRVSDDNEISDTGKEKTAEISPVMRSQPYEKTKQFGKLPNYAFGTPGNEEKPDGLDSDFEKY